MVGRGRGRGGFTLVELLIVVVVIGILAAIALPRLWTALDRAREGVTLGRLGMLRSAIVGATGNNRGRFPPTLTQAGAPTPGSDNWSEDLHADFARFVDELPLCEAGKPPFDDASTEYSRGVYQTTKTRTEGGVPGGNYRGWFYCPTDGHLCINNTAPSTEGVPFKDY